LIAEVVVVVVKEAADGGEVFRERVVEVGAAVVERAPEDGHSTSTNITTVVQSALLQQLLW